jgi:hypothetical protein
VYFTSRNQISSQKRDVFDCDMNIILDTILSLSDSSEADVEILHFIRHAVQCRAVMRSLQKKKKLDRPDQRV